ncbi:MAG: carbohydrate ABC transporter permease [Treponema sp.]|nr:carbohydrate ABC transporter permease [Treponema sp.]
MSNQYGKWGVFKFIVYASCIFLGFLSVFPFVVMFINATRSTDEIWRESISLIPSTHLLSNFGVFAGKSYNPLVGLMNSMIISVSTTICAVYFSSLTAYGLVAYSWKLRQAFFTFILVIIMIPAQVVNIGFYQFMLQIGLTNNFLPLILPAIASPAMVFFMRQYLMATLSLDIVDSARIDGAKEFFTFNRIILPMMKPAIATQAIFVFVGSWNNFFLPLIFLTDSSLYTMPIMVSLLRGDIYRVQLGAIYLGLSLSVLPLFVIFFSLSKYIIAGVQLGGVKE